MKFIGQKYLYLFGLCLVVLANFPLFQDGIAVKWDSVDNIWVFLRWYGSALRAGYFPDYFPYIFSGYPIGADIQAGPYNILYLGISYLFYDSLFSINCIYLITQILVFSLGYGIAGTYRFSGVTKQYLAFSLVASGYVIGHASHMSHLASAVGLLACFLGLRFLLLGYPRRAIVLVALGVYYQCTAGYVQDTIFGAMCLTLYWLYQSYLHRRMGWILCIPIGAALLGLLIGLPAILHFYNLFSQSTRGNGLDVADALSGSLPVYGILNFFYAPWVMQFTEPTLERFHLLSISGLLFIVAILVGVKLKEKRRFILPATLIAIIILLLALGKNDPFGIRGILAEHFFIFRAGRYPSAEHRGVALFVFALITCFGCQWILHRFPKFTAILLLVIIGDFLYLKYHLNEIQYSRVDKRLQAPVASFQVRFTSRDQDLIDAQRDCSMEGVSDLGSAIDFQKNKLAPHTFYWSGYEGLISKAYIENRLLESSLICGPSRLKAFIDGMPIKYDLLLYSPAKIQFKIIDKRMKTPMHLIWADVDDGFWKLRINGVDQAFQLSPAGLRGFMAKSGDQVEMIYKGPLSRLWRK